MSSASSTSSDDDNDENRLDSNDVQLLAAQKTLIYKHPLYPVLVYVLERCEQATLNPPLLLNNDESYTPSSSFEHNLKIFLSKNPDILTTPKHDNDEASSIIDSFYIDAMQVLRIHLLELDKVNDLCRDFCQRYIACLKVKLNANNIFTDDEDDEDEDFQSNMEENFESSEENDEDDFLINDKHILKEQHNEKQSLSNNGLNSICPPYTQQFDGQTPLSQIIASGPSSHGVDSSSILFDSFCNKRRKQSTIVSSSASPSSKRGILPKSATAIMRSWLFQHIVHPYPTEDEKRAISQKTNLSLLQVNNWFINARRRILQPMLEASNPDLAANKKKKRYDTTSDDHNHTHNRQVSNINRYWPSNLAQFNTSTSDQHEN